MGVAEYTIQAKNVDVDVILDATVAPKDKNNAVAFTKTSNELTLEVRSESLDIASNSQKNGVKSVESTITAGNADSLEFALTTKKANGDLMNMSFPIELNIYDDVDNTRVEGPIKITSSSFSYKGPLLTRAGNYRFEFTDSSDRFADKTFTVLPAKPIRLDAIASSSVFVR